MAEPTPPFTDEQLKGDDVGKKDLLVFLQENASRKFQREHKLKGQVKNVVKKKTKDQLVDDYKKLFETKEFKKEGEEEEEDTHVEKVTEKTAKLKVMDTEHEKEEKKYRKIILKKGDTKNFPNKKDTVSCFYTGKLPDGTVFDTNTTAKRGKKPQPLRFRVGVGNVIKGWDEALLTMSAGEKAQLTIEPEWAYGKKGLEGKIPPNTALTFEVELCGID